MSSDDAYGREELREQYKTPTNFNARIRLHGRYTSNPVGMFPWIFDQIEVPADARVLELGSGTAAFWRINAARIPPGWRSVLSDYSEGMLNDVRRNVAAIPRSFRFMRIDAQALPFADHSFDAVIANHMLYHVPEIPTALAEIRRVLVPGRSCYAATMGHANMREFEELVQRLIGRSVSRAARRFGLETGFDHMRKIFPQVEIRKYDDALNVTEAQPLIDYINSTRLGTFATEEQKDAVREFVETEIRAHGAFHISKDVGILIATA